jgi:hypothetical protein
MTSPGYHIMDIGLHYNWKKGSQTALIIPSNLAHSIDFNAIKVGDTIELPCMGFDKNGPIFGNNIAAITWYGEAVSMVNTVQKATVLLDLHGNKTFYVNKRHVAISIITKRQYRNRRNDAIAYFERLQHGQDIDCIVLSANSRKKQMQIKLFLPGEELKVETTLQPIVVVSEQIPVTTISNARNYWQKVCATFGIKLHISFSNRNNATLQMGLR